MSVCLLSFYLSRSFSAPGHLHIPTISLVRQTPLPLLRSLANHRTAREDNICISPSRTRIEAATPAQPGRGTKCKKRCSQQKTYRFKNCFTTNSFFTAKPAATRAGRSRLARTGWCDARPGCVALRLARCYCDFTHCQCLHITRTNASFPHDSISYLLCEPM